MNNAYECKISAIIDNEEELENVINQLVAEVVARSDISVQGSPDQVEKKYGRSYVTPETIQGSYIPPKKEHFLRDDFGWVIGFSFALPLVICLIVAIFIIGDVRSLSDNLFYGCAGALVGGVIGGLCAKMIQRQQKKQTIKQENKGGFVLWVITHDEQHTEKVVNILNDHHAQDIKVENLMTNSL